MTTRALASLFGALAALTLAGPAGAATFTPTDDTFATTADPGTAYGTGQWIRVGSGTATRNAYFKFALTGLSGTVSKATLRVYTVTGGAGFSARAAASNAWSETTLNANNQPGYSPTVVGSVGSFPTNSWVAVDVTPLVSGNGTYSFALTSSSTTPMDFTAKEYGAANAPQLVVTTTTTPPPPPPPTGAPTVSGVGVSSVGPYSATVNWTTDQPSSSVVEYGTATSYGVWSAVDSTQVTSHSVTLNDLMFNKAYHFRVRSTNSAGTGTSADATFTTSTLPATARVSSVSSTKQFLLDKHPFFPIMQWLQCGSLLDTNVALGVDVFMGNSCSGTSNQSYLDQIRQRNALGIVTYDSSVKSHPALAGWNGPDEPDSNGNIPPSTIQSQFDSNRANDPGHANFLTLSPNFFSQLTPPSWMNGDRSYYKQYAAAADFPGFDIYPIYGWCQPSWIWWEASATQEWNTTYSPVKPNYSWIEAASTSSQWCTGRGVYDYEVRAEVWMTIANGSKGIGYFTHSWSPTYSQFRVDSTVQTEMTRTNRQVTNFSQPLLGQAASVTQQTVSGAGNVDFVARQYDGATYVFAVNVDNAASTTVRFNGTALASKKVTVFEESRTISADATGFQDTFAPLAVHVYVVPPAGA
jgi:hypothetical protein